VNDTVQTFDVPAILRNRPYLDLVESAAETKAGEAFRILAPFGTGGLVVGGFTGQTPWEIHPETDELLYAVEGEAEITILTEDGTQRGILRQGEACIVPKGLWHRQLARLGVKFLAISGPGSHSWADDPRSELG
jgi:mannose-6-phosphate isomerase-like protein (cupin superfamily)